MVLAAVRGGIPLLREIGGDLCIEEQDRLTNADVFPSQVRVGGEFVIDDNEVRVCSTREHATGCDEGRLLVPLSSCVVTVFAYSVLARRGIARN